MSNSEFETPRRAAEFNPFFHGHNCFTIKNNQQTSEAVNSSSSSSSTNEEDDEIIDKLTINGAGAYFVDMETIFINFDHEKEEEFSKVIVMEKIHDQLSITCERNENLKLELIDLDYKKVESLSSNNKLLNFKWPETKYDLLSAKITIGNYQISQLLCINISKDVTRKSQACRSILLHEKDHLYSGLDSSRLCFKKGNYKISFHANEWNLDFTKNGLRLPKSFFIKTWGKITNEIVMAVRGIGTFKDVNQNNIKSYKIFNITIPDTYKEKSIIITPTESSKNGSIKHNKIGPIHLLDESEHVRSFPKQGNSVNIINGNNITNNNENNQQKKRKSNEPISELQNQPKQKQNSSQASTVLSNSGVLTTFREEVPPSTPINSNNNNTNNNIVNIVNEPFSNEFSNKLFEYSSKFSDINHLRLYLLHFINTFKEIEILFTKIPQIFPQQPIGMFLWLSTCEFGKILITKLVQEEMNISLFEMCYIIGNSNELKSIQIFEQLKSKLENSIQLDINGIVKKLILLICKEQTLKYFQENDFKNSEKCLKILNNEENQNILKELENN